MNECHRFLLTFTEEILNGKLYFLCSVYRSETATLTSPEHSESCIKWTDTCDRQMQVSGK